MRISDWSSDVCSSDLIAEALRHFAALPVQREAVGEDRAIGRAAAGAAAFEQGGLEPAAMLVGPFEIEVGAGVGTVAALHDEAVGGAAVEPDVEDVVHHLIVVKAIGRASCRERVCRYV